MSVPTTLVAGGSWPCYQSGQQLVKGVLLPVYHLPLLVKMCQHLLLLLHLFAQHLSLPRDKVCKYFLVLGLACNLTTQNLILLHCNCSCSC